MDRLSAGLTVQACSFAPPRCAEGGIPRGWMIQPPNSSGVPAATLLFLPPTESRKDGCAMGTKAPVDLRRRSIGRQSL